MLNKRMAQAEIGFDSILANLTLLEISLESKDGFRLPQDQTKYYIKFQSYTQGKSTEIIPFSGIELQEMVIICIYSMV